MKLKGEHKVTEIVVIDIEPTKCFSALCFNHFGYCALYGKRLDKTALRQLSYFRCDQCLKDFPVEGR